MLCDFVKEIYNQSSFPLIQGKKGEIQGSGGPIVSALGSGSSCLGSSPGLGHYTVSLGKRIYSHSTSLHPGVWMGTDKLNAAGNPAMDQHPIQGGVEILLVASCYRNQDKLPGGYSLIRA